MKNNKNEFVKPGGLDLKDRLVSIQRVTKVTKGGRAFGFTAIVVVGDENGVVGHGLGKNLHEEPEVPNYGRKGTGKSIKNGFLVTEMLGMSFNPLNGDYSRGATGFKIENGEINR